MEAWGEDSDTQNGGMGILTAKIEEWGGNSDRKNRGIGWEF
jgi:hypothetical protein